MPRVLTRCLLLLVALICLCGFRHQGPKAYLEIAQILASDGFNDTALAYYTKAVATQPDDPELYQARAFFLLRLERTREALADLSRIVTLRPERPDGYLSRGLVYSQLGQAEQADRDFAAACRLGDQSGCAFLQHP